MSIHDLIARTPMRCTRCGKESVGSLTACGCWVACPCGWMRSFDGPCSNPAHGGAGKMAPIVTKRISRKKKPGSAHSHHTPLLPPERSTRGGG